MYTYKNPEKNLKMSSGKKEGAREENKVDKPHKKSVVIIVFRRPHTSPTAPHSKALLANPFCITIREIGQLVDIREYFTNKYG